MIWANLLHLSCNMWGDREAPDIGEYVTARPYLRFDDDLWRELLGKMAGAGMNMVVIDLGDGVRYDSHPEIAVDGAWTVSRLQEELAIARDLGLEPIPKLNFSTTHDTWLGPYSKCVSTDAYYAVCRDLIAEVCDIFGKPRFFHIGMDEEGYDCQRNFEYVVIRQFELWWRDLYYLVDQVESGGSRAWIWSDYLWGHPDEFFNKMPKTIVQSDWYYGEAFGESDAAVRAYTDLESHGYDQIPTGSNFVNAVNFGLIVPYCRKRIAPERLLGFLQTPWFPTLPACRDHHLRAIEQVRKAKDELSL